MDFKSQCGLEKKIILIGDKKANFIELKEELIEIKIGEKLINAGR